MASPLLTPHDAPLKVDPSPWVERAWFYACQFKGYKRGDDRVYDTAMDCLIRACQTWDENKGKSFRNWLLVWINSRLKNEYNREKTIRSYLTQKGIPEFDESMRVNGEQIDHAERVEYAHTLIRSLEPKNQIIVDLRFRGATPKEISERIGLTRQAISLREMGIVADLRASQGFADDRRTILGGVRGKRVDKDINPV